MKPLGWVALGLVLLSITGCWGQLNIENVGPILQIGLENAPNGRLLVTHSLPVFGTANKKQDELVSMQTEIIRESREIWQRISPQVPQGGTVQQYLFAKDLAQHGISPWMEVFQRDPVNPPLIPVVIVDGSPNELMKKAARFKDKPRTALYIKQLIEHNRNKYAVDMDIFHFTIAYAAPGIDPVAPVIKLRPRDIQLTGTALFTEDRMVGSLNINQTILLLALMGRLKNAEYIFRHPAPLSGRGPAKPAAAARIATAKCKTKLHLKDGRPEVALYLKLSGTLDEYRWDRMDLPKSQQQLEQSFAKELTRCCNQLIRKLQHTNSDPMGIGDRIRVKYYRYWKQNDPKQIYQTARIKVRIKMHITNYGTIK